MCKDSHPQPTVVAVKTLPKMARLGKVALHIDHVEDEVLDLPDTWSGQSGIVPTGTSTGASAVSPEPIVVELPVGSDAFELVAGAVIDGRGTVLRPIVASCRRSLRSICANVAVPAGGICCCCARL